MSLFLPEKWIWDFWLAEDGDTWHVFFLQADKAIGDPELRHANASVGHAISRDLRSWGYLGTALSPDARPGFDDSTTWTGSVTRHNGEWVMFYTGNSKKSHNTVQRIGMARSTDLHAWKRFSANPVIDDLPAPYENRHFPDRWHDRSLRDPDVRPDPVRGGWRMHFTARVENQDADAAGCIGAAWSADLTHWQVLPPVVAPEIASELEVPQFLEINNRWYLLFCTGANRLGARFKAAHPEVAGITGTHYFLADTPDGPWRLGPSMFFAGDARGSQYAGKLVPTRAGLFFMGFLNFDAEGKFLGELSDPIPVAVSLDGSLTLSK
jgi:beta-fructofuranosidase